MATKADIFVEQHNDPKLVLTPMINQWMFDHNDRFTPEAMETVYKAMTTPPRDRSKSYSASSAGTCLRRQELGFLGKPRRPADPHLQDIFTTGSWEHAKWQARLLSANLLEEIEVPLFWPKMLSKGSADGKGFVWWDTVDPKYRQREFLIEIKTANSFYLNKILESGKPTSGHLAQMHRYMLVSGIDMCIYFLVDKSGTTAKPWYEIVVEADPEMLNKSQEELDQLVRAAEEKKLHPIKPGCKLTVDPEYRSCDYRGKTGPCFTTEEWA